MNKVFEFDFSAAHFYNQKKWSSAKNQEEFGLCYSEYGHGHNYKLILKFSESANSEKNIATAVKYIIKNLDHQHLNFTLDYFKEVVPTTENIALYIWNKLRHQPTIKINNLRLYETNHLWVEIQEPVNGEL